MADPHPHLQISGGPGQPDPEIRGEGAVSKKSFSGPWGLILVEKWGGRAHKVAKFHRRLYTKVCQISRICRAISSLVFKNHVQNLHLCKFKGVIVSRLDGFGPSQELEKPWNGY